MTTNQDPQVSRRELRQLKWLTALVPFMVVPIYEAARREALASLPVEYANVVVWITCAVADLRFAT